MTIKLSLKTIYAKGVAEHVYLYDFMVFEKNGKYYARDANGNIKFSGTNKDSVIQSAIDALTKGNVYLKDISLPSAITLKASVVVTEVLKGVFTCYQSGKPVFSTFDKHDDGLVLYFPFEKVTADRAIDVSRFDNEGKNNGATIVAGKLGEALSFNGSNNWVVVPEKPSLNITTQITLMAWVKWAGSNAAGDCQNVIRKGRVYAYYNTGYFVGSGGVYSDVHSAIKIGAFPTTLAFSKPPSWFLDTWRFIAFTYDGSYMRNYLNGELDVSQAQTGTIQTTTDRLTIGARSEDWGERFCGLIDEVKIYNRALSAEEIKQHYLASALRYGVIEVIENKLKRNSGTATFNGDGTTTDFLIGAHGLAENPSDRARIHVKVTPVSGDAVDASPCVAYASDEDADGAFESIRVKFINAPISGTNNVVVRWKAELC